MKHGYSIEQSSPTIFRVLNQETWEQILASLLMEFQNEVIGKHPVIKHLKFGSLLSFESV
jgi:hypothetical protein